MPHPHSSFGRRDGQELLGLCLINSELFFSVTAEVAFSCHAEASAGSPCEVRVVKKETEEAAQFSADSQLTGRSCFFHAGARRKPAATFVIDSSSKDLTPFFLDLLWKHTVHAGGRKGGTRA